ncbi:type IV pilin protein [Pseudomonas sp. NFR16]|jgi:type IV pilus assembly protein PilE|uniref:type IV pilin protein n=1 Tax=Pseudomonas sp. NFR16 TaxID=1566248 RepID=UPI0008B5410F|nr:type IV pilin protein [Pseudomonas sp. NFR16]SEJ51779.1 type IV pilus assembly protein PilE [Pseudomonas sp. NFR16]
MHRSKHSQRGFTLIELMITVAIVAILATIAYPAYTKYVIRGYRSEGMAMLTDAVARMERYYAQNNSYAVPAPALEKIGITNANSINNKYTLSFSGTPTPTTYTLQATPINAQTADSCGTLSITQDGTKTPADCWK